MKLFTTLFFILLVFNITLFAQDKPIRLGVKAGTPIIVGVSGEYVTRLLGGKLAIFGDYTDFTYDFKYYDIGNYNLILSTSYWEAGLNYYLLREGRGLYLSASYGELDSRFLLENYEHNFFDNGTGYTDYTVASGLVKIGAKIGQWFYIKPEIGIMLNGLTSSVDVAINFDDDTQLVHTLALPKPFSMGLIINLGFGFGF